MRLNVKAFALTCALFWGLGLFLLTWWIILINGSSSTTTFLGRMYPGYSMTPLGSVFGLVWALVDGLISGAIFAWLYNLLAGGSQEKEPAQPRA